MDMKNYKIIIDGKIQLMTKAEIENLDTSKMSDMTGMFSLAHDFNGDLSKWDVSSVTSMNEMFQNCTHFMRNGVPWNINNNNSLNLFNE